MKVSKLEKAAIGWFHSHKPCAWTKKQHIENPSVNTCGDAEQLLANEAAKFLVKLEVSK